MFLLLNLIKSDSIVWFPKIQNQSLLILCNVHFNCFLVYLIPWIAFDVIIFRWVAKLLVVKFYIGTFAYWSTKFGKCLWFTLLSRFHIRCEKFTFWPETVSTNSYFTVKLRSLSRLRSLMSLALFSSIHILIFSFISNISVGSRSYLLRKQFIIETIVLCLQVQNIDIIQNLIWYMWFFFTKWKRDLRILKWIFWIVLLRDNFIR